MLTEPNNRTLAEKCARLIALHTALECPSTPQSPEDAAKAELIRLIAFEPDRVADAITLSTKILHERDFIWGLHPGVIYDSISLAEYFGVDLPTTESAIRLCGGMRIDGEWKDDARATFVLDADAIVAVNKEPAAK